MRYIRRLLLAVLVLGLLLLGVVFFFLATNAGLNIGLSVVPNLQVAQTNGSLLGGLQLQQVHFQQTGLDAQLQRVQLRWQPWALLQAKVRVQQLSIEGVQLALSPASTEPVPPSEPLKALPDMQLPVEIHIDELWLRDLHFKQADNSLYLQELRLALQTQDGWLTVDDLSLQQLQAREVELAQAQLVARMALQHPHTLSLSLGADARHAVLGAATLESQALGDPRALQLDTQILLVDQQRDAPLQLQVAATLQDLLGNLRWQTAIHLRDVDSRHSTLQMFLQDVPHYKANAEFQAQGDLQQAQADLTLHTEIAELGTFDVQFSAANLEKDWQQWRLQGGLRQADMPLQVDVEGVLDARQAQPHIDASINWQALRVPLQGEETQVASRQGKLTWVGTADAYQVTLDGEVQAANAPDTRWTLAAAGNTQQARIDFLRAELLGGLGVANLQISRAANGGVLADLEVSHSQHQNATQLEVQGTIAGERVSLDWHINAPYMQALHPQAHGSLRGSGKIGGWLTRPTVQATLQGRDLFWQDQRLDQLDVEANIDVNAPDGLMDLALHAQGLHSGDLSIDTLGLQAQGSMAAHSLTLTAQLPLQSATLSLQGGLLNRDNWQGSLQTLQLDDQQWGRLKLAAPAALQASAQQVRLEQACLKLELQQQRGSQLCLRGAWQASQDSIGAAQASLTLDELSLEVLQAFLPASLHIQDIATSLQLDAELLKNGELRSNLLFNLTPGLVQLKNPQQDPITLLKHQGTQVSARIDSQGLQAQLKLQLPEQDGIQARLHLPNLKRFPLAEEQPLDGDIKLQFGDFSLLSLFAPQMSEPQGRIEADVKLTGQMMQPLLQGQLRLRDGGAKVELAGLHVHDMQLVVRNPIPTRELGNETVTQPAGTHLKLDGQLRMGDQTQGEAGLLRIDGDFIAATDWAARLNVKGHRLEVMNSPEIWLLASPNVQFEGSPQRISLSGEIVLPEALITPPEKPGGAGKVSASSDVVVLSDTENTDIAAEDRQAQAPRLPFYTDLRLLLGDQLRVKGMGFKGRLQGNLRVLGKPHQGLTGSGRISVLDGHYKAYGQDLRIRKGNVLYSGGALENPGLDVQAVRVVGEVTAGIELSGTAQAPELNLFSEPALDQTNILSYIVLGRPASSGSATSINQQQLLAQALSDLALNEDSAVSKALRDDLGLDTAGIDTSGGTEQTTFMLGKYLTPDLYISYGVGLFEADNVFRMRYRLSPRFSVESATSGGNSGVDLHYTLER